MISPDDLLALLPAVHRLRDAAAAGDVTGTRGALRGLVTVLAAEADVLDADIERLGDAWFIETCAPWLVPYIGDLLGVRPLHPVGAGSRRAHVANTVGYRRRKGTAAVLEQLADDVTGWRTSAVEYFTRLATTQHSRHVRPVRTPALRSPHVADLADGPFDTAPRSAEVRRSATRGGRFNLPVVGLHTWRVQPYPMHHAEARRVAPGRWTFDPLGRDVPLFNAAAGTTERHSRAAEHELPGPLRRLALRDELDALRRGQARTPVWFAAGAPVLSVARRLPDGALEPVPPERLLVADLALWQRPPTEVTVPQAGGAGTRPIAAAIDPERGRLTFPTSAEPVEVRVGYAYGAPGDLGGGPYDRRERFDATYRDRVGWRAVVSRSWDESPAPAYRLLRDAVLAWNAQLAGPDPVPVGEIVIADSGIHLLERPPFEGIPDPRGLTGRAAVRLRPGCELRIVAAQTDELAPDATHTPAPGERLVPAGVRPVLAGNVSVLSRGGGLAGAGRLVLDGLWIAGQVTVRAGNLAELRLSDCTIAPPSGIGVNVSGTYPTRRNTALAVVLERTITGPLDLQRAAALSAREVVVDGAGGAAITAAEAVCTLDDSTVLGASATRSVDASNSIFTGPVAVERRQAGCMRYCALPATSVTPRRFRCQPDLAAAAADDPAARSPDPDAEAARARVAPSFSALSFGRPGYTQLAERCAPELAAGGEDGTEIGVWRHLRQPQRRANLAAGLDEYLRAGLEAGPLYVT